MNKPDVKKEKNKQTIWRWFWHQSKSYSIANKQQISLQTDRRVVQSLFLSSMCLPQGQQDTGRGESLGSTA